MFCPVAELLDGLVQHIHNLTGRERCLMLHQLQHLIVAKPFTSGILCLIQAVGIHQQLTTPDIFDGLALENSPSTTG